MKMQVGNIDMKVYQLLENDWDNQELTLDYLFKKQFSLCYRVEQLIQKIGRLPIFKEYSPSSVLVTEYGVPEIEPLWREMLQAKKQFEKAGGNYNDYY